MTDEAKKGLNKEQVEFLEALEKSIGSLLVKRKAAGVGVGSESLSLDQGVELPAGIELKATGPSCPLCFRNGRWVCC